MQNVPFAIVDERPDMIPNFKDGLGLEGLGIDSVDDRYAVRSILSDGNPEVPPIETRTSQPKHREQDLGRRRHTKHGETRPGGQPHGQQRERRRARALAGNTQPRTPLEEFAATVQGGLSAASEVTSGRQWSYARNETEI